MSERHSRQLLFPEIGKKGQEQIAAARVAIVGCGALGTVAAEILVRAGVGTLTLIDRDVVELSNLQRQSLFTENDAKGAREKSLAAAAALREIDSSVGIRALVEDLVPKNAERLLAGHDLFIDATDNFAARFLLNDVAWKSRIPWVYGAAVSAEGTFAVFRPGLTPCFRCFLEELPSPGSTPTCDTAGVIGPITHLVASLQASEALKVLVGAPSMRGVGLVSLWDPSGPSVRIVLERAVPRPDCPTCGLSSYPALAGEGSEFARSLCGRNSVQLIPETPRLVDLDAVSARLSSSSEVTRSDESLTATFPETSITLFRDGRAIVTGTLEPERGRALFSRYIGS